MTSDWFESLQTEAKCSALAESDADVGGNPGQTVNAIGPYLRGLRGNRSLRQMQESTGIAYSYLSNIERGSKRPGESVLSRLADYHNVPLGGLLAMAGISKGPDADPEFSNANIRRSFRYVLDDPVFVDYPKPTESVPIETQRFVVQLYEHFTGKQLLE